MQLLRKSNYDLRIMNVLIGHVVHTGYKFLTIIFFFRAAEARNRLRIMRLRYQANKVSAKSFLVILQTK